jgi:hypothetical protein
MVTDALGGTVPVVWMNMLDFPGGFYCENLRSNFFYGMNMAGIM